MAIDQLISLREIKMAAADLLSLIRRTPILPVAAQASEVGGERLFVKAENLQVTGSYKIRPDVCRSARVRGAVQRGCREAKR